MAFEPFGYGNRWYDRVGGRKLRPKEMAIMFLIVMTLAMIWQLS
jgi:hypothetical protein